MGNYLSNLVGAFGGGDQQTNMPNPSNLAAMSYIKLQADEEKKNYQELNNKDEVYSGQTGVSFMSEVKRLGELELANPKEKAGITDSYIAENSQFKNRQELQRWGAGMVNTTSTTGGIFEGGPSYGVLWNQGDSYLEELNTSTAKDMLGINPGNTITGIQADYDVLTEQMKYSFTVRNENGTEAFATVGGTPIVDLAGEGGIPNVEENIIRVTADKFDMAVTKGVAVVQEGLSPDALLASPPQFSITSDSTDFNVAGVGSTLDKISPNEEPEVQQGSNTTSETVDVTGTGDYINVQKVNPTSYAVPGVGMVDFTPTPAGGKYQDIAPLIKDDGNMVLVNPNGTRRDKTPTAQELVAIPSDIPENYLPFKARGLVKEGEQLYVDPTPDSNGYHALYDSSGKQLGRGSLGGIGAIKGEEKQYVESLVTGFDSTVALSANVSDVINRPNVNEVSSNFNPELRNNIETALNNKNWDQAVSFIEQGVNENLLDADDQVALVSLIQKSQGNFFSLNFDEKTAIAAASMSAIPRAERTAALAKQFAYFMETGKLDFNTRGLDQTAQNIQISQDNQFMSELNTISTAVAGVNDASEGSEGEDTLKTQTAALKLIEDKILANGSTEAKAQYFKTKGLSASKRLAVKAQDDRWFSGLRAFVMNRDTDPTIAPGQIMPNIVALDRNKNYTTDPTKVQFVQFIRQGSSGRTSGEPVSLYGSATQFSSDDLELFKDVAIYNTSIKKLVKD